MSESLEPGISASLWIQVSLNVFSFLVCVYMSFSLSLRPSPFLSFSPSVPPSVRQSMLGQNKFLTERKVWPAVSLKQLIRQGWTGLEREKASGTMPGANLIARRGKGLRGLQWWQWKWKGKGTQRCHRSKQLGWRDQLAGPLRLPAWVTAWESGGSSNRNLWEAKTDLLLKVMNSGCASLSYWRSIQD